MGVYYPWCNQKNVVKAVRIILALLVVCTTATVDASFSVKAQADDAPTGASALTAHAAQHVTTQRQPTSQLATADLNALQLQEQEDGATVTVVWPNPTVTAATATAMLQQLPHLRYQGYELPMQLFTVVLSDDVTAFGDLNQLYDKHAVVASDMITPLTLHLDAQPWPVALEPAAPLQPAAIGWETMADPLRPAEIVALPTAPLFLLRQGIMDGQQVGIFALSPLYTDAGVVKFATALTAQIPHAKLLSDDSTQPTANERSLTEPKATLQTHSPNAFEPVNPFAAQQAVKLIVSEVGMQEITGAQLAGAGMELATTNPAQLQLHVNAAEVALQMAGLVSGRLAATSTIRFYASQVGDRLNTHSVYWLGNGETAGVRMATRAVAPAAAPARSTVWEQGIWQANQLYDSRYAGTDGDHWFHQKLVPSDNTASALDLVDVAVAPHLPLVAGTATYTIAVTTNVRGTHTLRVLLNNSAQDIVWNTADTQQFSRDWQQPFTSTITSDALQIALSDLAVANAQTDVTVLLDKVFWQQPVQLQLQQQGAHFTGVAGTWRYEWTGVPADFQLYDVTNAVNPLLLSGATTAGFQDGPMVHQYLVAGPGTVHTPEIVAHQPVIFGTKGANAIYITPALFIDALEPLLQLRRAQGYQVAVVDVQEIYDAWSYGQVSPEAIRTFLRFAHASWSPSPIAVTLVGDGTWDPHDYEGKSNVNFIPPYLANVDPWLVETACDNCYVQLDGEDPSAADGIFDTDLWLGRLPVKSASELTNLIKKLISYETSTTIGMWQNRVVFIADNYVRARVDDNYIVDLAGDFAAYGDSIAALTPGTVNTTRIYYDPFPAVADPEGNEPWRIADASAALKAVQENLSYGAGVVSYNGHSNQWQWAITAENDPTTNTNYLLSLYDTDALTNKDHYFISLSMTCLTGQFHKPALSGTVIDERMLLNPNGGAIAVWGSTGLSVAYGHDLLQKGFFEALWSTPSQTARVGELVDAGYAKLLSEQSCCQDTLKTFTLLGDPLTKVRVRLEKVEELYLPIVSR